MHTEIAEQLCTGTVFADRDRLLQVLTSLLSNAVKFGGEGSLVRIDARSTAGGVRLEVTDQGPGIPEPFHGQLFDKFTQADTGSTRAVKGTGLGLNISKAIVEQHGGEIGFNTEEGVGTTFFFELPNAAQPDDRATPEPRFSAFPNDATGPLVLVCEDDPDIADVIARSLREQGCTADLVYDAAQATVALAQRDYRALFLDLSLPDQGGTSLVRDLRNNPRTTTLPIVVVSAAVGRGRREFGGEQDEVIDWVSKPFAPLELKNALNVALKATSASLPRVLHVEDDQDLAGVIRTQLAASVTVIAASTLAQAREKLSTEQFDLVLLDVGLPDGSGLDLIPEIHRRFGGTIAILIFCGEPVPDVILRHVDGIVRKGDTDAGELQQSIREILGREQD